MGMHGQDPNEKSIPNQSSAELIILAISFTIIARFMRFPGGSMGTTSSWTESAKSNLKADCETVEK